MITVETVVAGVAVVSAILATWSYIQLRKQRKRANKEFFDRVTHIYFTGMAMLALISRANRPRPEDLVDDAVSYASMLYKEIEARKTARDQGRETGRMEG